MMGRLRVVDEPGVDDDEDKHMTSHNGACLLPRRRDCPSTAYSPVAGALHTSVACFRWYLHDRPRFYHISPFFANTVRIFNPILHIFNHSLQSIFPNTIIFTIFALFSGIFRHIITHIPGISDQIYSKIILLKTMVLTYRPGFLLSFATWSPTFPAFLTTFTPLSFSSHP